MPELTPERLAELREMHKKATEPEHWQGIADRQRGVFEDFRLHLDGYDAELALALRNSASELFDLAQEALTARGKNSPADAALKAAAIRDRETVRELREKLEALKVPARELTENFAWSGITADCEELRLRLNSLIDELRAAMSAADQEQG